MRRRLIGLSLACVAATTACGDQNSYEAATQGLRAWLMAVETGSAEACDLETGDYHDELLAEHAEYGGPGTTCIERVSRMHDGDPRPPSSDSRIDVPAWDPSGEALVQVTDSRTGESSQYWMVFEDSRWLVAGDEQ